MIQQLPPIEELRTLPEAYQTETLDLLFEPSPAIHATLLPIIFRASYSSYTDLIERCRVALFELAASRPMSRPSPTLLSIIGSHPRLGARKIDSALSRAEQANLAGEGENFARMNREYEEKFPGLRFVIFVDDQSRAELLEVMQLRINRGDFAKEVVESLEVCMQNMPHVVRDDVVVALLTCAGYVRDSHEQGYASVTINILESAVTPLRSSASLSP
ncbi:hypothetical protein E4U33_007275 [Claviceps sp. LM78 group G4]|nr:hypothetical protein E4U33_007275 [Claviceps sp. LM78 group G4]